MAHLAHYKEAHPLPFVITHWINVVAMVFLILSGIIIHFPVIPGIMGICRGLHMFFGIVIFVNCIVRIVLSFFVKSAPTGGTRKTVKDYKTYLPQKDNRHQLGAWIKYYLFMKKDHPLGAKLGVPQKLSYLLVPILIIIMFVSGMCLADTAGNWGWTTWLNNLVDGPMNMRIIHYFGMYAFIVFMFIHVYLANIEGTEPTKLMFFRKEHGGMVYDPDKHVIVSEDPLDENAE